MSANSFLEGGERRCPCVGLELLKTRLLQFTHLEQAKTSASGQPPFPKPQPNPQGFSGVTF